MVLKDGEQMIKNLVVLSGSLVTGYLLIKMGIPRNYVCGLGIMLIFIGAIWYA